MLSLEIDGSIPPPSSCQPLDLSSDSIGSHSIQQITSFIIQDTVELEAFLFFLYSNLNIGFRRVISGTIFVDLLWHPTLVPLIVLWIETGCRLSPPEVIGMNVREEEAPCVCPGA